MLRRWIALSLTSPMRVQCMSSRKPLNSRCFRWWCWKSVASHGTSLLFGISPKISLCVTPATGLPTCICTWYVCMYERKRYFFKDEILMRLGKECTTSINSPSKVPLRGRTLSTRGYIHEKFRSERGPSACWRSLRVALDLPVQSKSA